jgi:hypothetical protein
MKTYYFETSVTYTDKIEKEDRVFSETFSYIVEAETEGEAIQDAIIKTIKQFVKEYYLTTFKGIGVEIDQFYETCEGARAD